MKAISYRNGDKIEYTGKTMKIHGGFFYEFTYLDGLKKGENGVTQSIPEDKESFHALLLVVQNHEAMKRTLSKIFESSYDDYTGKTYEQIMGYDN